MTLIRDHSPSVGTSRRLALLVCICAATLAGCATRGTTSSGIFEPYRTDLPQGNYLTSEMLSRVQPGMTKAAVRLTLGTPLLNEMFRPDRWIYVFRYQHPNGDSVSRHAIVYFKDDRVERIEADDMPSREDPNDPALPGFRPKPSRVQ